MSVSRGLTLRNYNNFRCFCSWQVVLVFKLQRTAARRKCEDEDEDRAALPAASSDLMSSLRDKIISIADAHTSSPAATMIPFIPMQRLPKWVKEYHDKRSKDHRSTRSGARNGGGGARARAYSHSRGPLRAERSTADQAKVRKLHRLSERRKEACRDCESLTDAYCPS